MWWIIGFFAFVTLVIVIPTMRMSSLCSREEEKKYKFTIGDVADICKDYGYSAVIENGKFEGFIKE